VARATLASAKRVGNRLAGTSLRVEQMFARLAGALGSENFENFENLENFIENLENLEYGERVRVHGEFFEKFLYTLYTGNYNNQLVYNQKTR